MRFCALFCAIVRRRKKAHSKICSTQFFVVILQHHSFRRVVVFRYVYHEETPNTIFLIAKAYVKHSSLIMAMVSSCSAQMFFGL